MKSLADSEFNRLVREFPALQSRVGEGIDFVNFDCEVVESCCGVIFFTARAQMCPGISYPKELVRGWASGFPFVEEADDIVFSHHVVV